MRIYVFGDDKELCISMANELNEHRGRAIIGSSMDFAELAPRMGKDIDCAIYITDNPPKAVIEANRDRRIRAVVCYNQRNISDGMRAKANLFVFDKNSRELPNPSALLSGAKLDDAVERRAAPQMAKEKRIVVEKSSIASKGAGMFDKVRQRFLDDRKAKEEDGVEESSEYEEEEDVKPGEGIQGRIKYIFGID
jgi:hypothetical protein